MNRELDADFDVDAFEHVAVFDTDREWIEMRLRSTRAQTVHLAALDLDVPFAAGEEMRTEVSAKFTREQIAEELAAAGMQLARWWTDPDGDFALLLARPA
jgi:L-histidine N-alpha-methyltransferase